MFSHFAEIENRKVSFLPVCWMNESEFDQAVPNVNGILRQQLAALVKGILYNEGKIVHCIIICFWLFRNEKCRWPKTGDGGPLNVQLALQLTNYKSNGNIVRKSYTITNRYQFFVSNDWSHFQCERSTYTKTSTTSGKPKLNTIFGCLRNKQMIVLVNDDNNDFIIRCPKTENYLRQFDLQRWSDTRSSQIPFGWWIIFT